MDMLIFLGDKEGRIVIRSKKRWTLKSQKVCNKSLFFQMIGVIVSQVIFKIVNHRVNLRKDCSVYTSLLWKIVLFTQVCCLTFITKFSAHEIL